MNCRPPYPSFLCLSWCYDKHRQCIKKQRHHFANKSLHSQSHGFSNSQVGMWELDHKEGWVLKNWCFQTMVLKKTLESLLDFKEIKPVNPKGTQHWMFIRRTDAEAEAPILLSPDWRLKAKGEEGSRWDDFHWLKRHEFQQIPGDNEGQGSLQCYSPWGHEELDMTKQLNNIILTNACYMEKVW